MVRRRPCRHGDCRCPREQRVNSHLDIVLPQGCKQLLPMVVQFVSEELLSDHKVVLAAVHNTGAEALQYTLGDLFSWTMN